VVADCDSGAAVCLEKLGRKDEALARAQKALLQDPSIEDAKKIVERLSKDPEAQPPQPAPEPKKK
jgi:hypothetical protein